MTRTLITTWHEHDESLETVLKQASRSLRIFDEDLTRLKLERPLAADVLHRFIMADSRNRIQIILRNTEPFQRQSPRLMKLFTQYPQSMEVFRCPEHLASLSDSLFLADEHHGLIRFHRDNVRSKVILDDRDECLPYIKRFEELLLEGGERITAIPLGL